MGVTIEDIRISNEFTTEDTNYLLGNIGDKVTIEVDFRAEEVYVTSGEEDVDRIYLAPQPFRVNVADSKDVVYSESVGSLENFREGDTIAIYNFDSMATFNYEIYEKLSNEAVRVHTIGGVAGDVDFYAANSNNYDTFFPTNSYIYITTNLTAINYRWNFVANESAETFGSLIDDELNQMKAANVDNTDIVTQVPLVFDSPTTNNIGSAYVKGNGATTTAQKFTVVHETFITPFFLFSQILDLKDGIAPAYFFAEECLKSIFSIDVGRNTNDPNFIQTVEFTFLDGNTGWFDENFNGKTNDYSIESTTYKRADLSVINAVELVTDEQTIEIVVKNTINDPFLAGSTEYALNFCILPEFRDDYVNNNKTITENFYFDRAFTTEGTPQAGDNLSSNPNYTIIKSVDAVVNDIETMTITATIQLSAAGVAELSSRADLEYMFWVSTQNHLLETEASDRVSILTDIQPFFIDLTDDGLITWETKFLRHYESDFDTEGTDAPIVRTEDDVLCYSQFYIDRNGRESDEVLLTNVNCELIAKKLDGSEFTLESFSQGFTGTQIVNDTQFIDNTIDRVFKMPTNEQRKQIVVNRRIDLDTTDLRYYEVKYPFLMRWEYWTALSGVTSDAFDTNEDNNGQNEEWQRYDTLADWDLFYRTTVSLTKNGTALNYQNETQLTTFDYEEDTDWTNETIVALDADTDTPIGNLLIAPTKIKASKTYVGGDAPALDDVEWVFRIEVYEQGGISDIRYFSSVYDWSENSWFSSVDTSNKIVKSVLGSVYSAEALIDANKLPSASEFKISARIYNEEALAPVTFCILQEDLEPILQENATDCIEVEHT